MNECPYIRNCYWSQSFFRPDLLLPSMLNEKQRLQFMKDAVLQWRNENDEVIILQWHCYSWAVVFSKTDDTHPFFHWLEATQNENRMIFYVWEN